MIFLNLAIIIIPMMNVSNENLPHLNVHYLERLSYMGARLLDHHFSRESMHSISEFEDNHDGINYTSMSSITQYMVISVTSRPETRLKIS